MRMRRQKDEENDLASESDVFVDASQHGFGVAAAATQDELFDEVVQDGHESTGLVGTIHDGLVDVGAVLGQSTKFTAKVLGRVCKKTDK